MEEWRKLIRNWEQVGRWGVSGRGRGVKVSLFFPGTVETKPSTEKWGKNLH